VVCVSDDAEVSDIIHYCNLIVTRYRQGDKENLFTGSIGSCKRLH
jgi:hypothetical protein